MNPERGADPEHMLGRYNMGRGALGEGNVYLV
jgi:hypothetical protein